MIRIFGWSRRLNGTRGFFCNIGFYRHLKGLVILKGAYIKLFSGVFEV